ncbi:MAG: carbon-nitrogen hydrolase family protein [Clostridiaceae bacterium]|nr:carbon-nitrogen hydrolase family protein [Clostridiaceae bacterium]
MDQPDKRRKPLRITCACLPASIDDLDHNMATMKTALLEARPHKPDLVVFGEAFLTGFNGLNFNYSRDAMKALFIRGKEISQIRRWAADEGVAIGFGFHENDHGYLFSSYLVIDRQGDIKGHYRRVSEGWRIKGTGVEYKEGSEFITFKLNQTNITILVCGDFWEDHLLMPIIDRDVDTDLFLWPVHCDYPIDEWHESIREEYRERSQILAKPVLFYNNYIDQEDRAKGGAYLWHWGRELGALAYGEPGLLQVEV